MDLLAVDPHPSLAEPLEARYHRARNRAYAAWANSQPQYVIPGVLDEPAPDSPLASPGAGSSSAPALTASGTEPRRDPELTANQLVTSEHPVFSHSGVVVGAATTTTTEAGANHSQVTRARLQEGA